MTAKAKPWRPPPIDPGLHAEVSSMRPKGVTVQAWFEDVVRSGVRTKRKSSRQ